MAPEPEASDLATEAIAVCTRKLKVYQHYIRPSVGSQRPHCSLGVGVVRADVALGPEDRDHELHDRRLIVDNHHMLRHRQPLRRAAGVSHTTQALARLTQLASVARSLTILDAASSRVFDELLEPTEVALDVSREESERFPMLSIAPSGS